MNKNVLFRQTFYTFFVSGLIMIMNGSLMPYIIADCGLSYGMAGMLLSSYAFGNLVANFVAGFSIHKFGLKKTAVMLSSLLPLTLTGIILTKNSYVLFALFFFEGIGRGTISNVSNTIINNTSSGSASPLNLLHMFYAVGAFISPIMAATLIGFGISWRIVVMIAIVLGVSMVAVYCIMKPDFTVPAQPQKKADVSKTVFYKNPVFYIAAGLMFFYMCMENALNGWLVTYLGDTGRTSAFSAQNMLSLLWVSIILGRLSCAYMSRFVDKRKIILCISVMTFAFFTLFVLSNSSLLIGFSIFGLGLFMGGIYPTTIANIGGIIKGSSSAMAVFLAINGVGAMLMPYITGALAESFGLETGMSAIAVAVAIMAVFSVLLKRSRVEN